MIRRCATVLAVALVLQSLTAAGQSNQEPLPRVSVALPPEVASETVVIVGFMSGEFGGYGTYVKARPNLRAYDIEASYEGKPAREIKLVVYAPGCEIMTFDIALPDASPVEQQFTCHPLPTLTLAGQIIPKQVRRSKVEVVYRADWANYFFGIMDGPVTTIPIATAVPDDAGAFQVQIPDLGKDPKVASSEHKGEFHFMLREASTGNILANLAPDAANTGWGALRIQSQYPKLIRFAASK